MNHPCTNLIAYPTGHIKCVYCNEVFQFKDKWKFFNDEYGTLQLEKFDYSEARKHVLEKHPEKVDKYRDKPRRKNSKKTLIPYDFEDILFINHQPADIGTTRYGSIEIMIDLDCNWKEVESGPEFNKPTGKQEKWEKIQLNLGREKVQEWLSNLLDRANKGELNFNDIKLHFRRNQKGTVVFDLHKNRATKKGGGGGG